MAAADVNGDGMFDLLTANQGTGTFGGHTDYAAGSGSRGLALADFNGAGLPDVALANSTASTISLLVQSKRKAILGRWRRLGPNPSYTSVAARRRSLPETK
jgi:hypothetical protein